ncbi:hypothetical protein N7462_005674 [Penicillium macrosclerotiorum]|uniref:uncharacterized protein n=1 Tax=Penicillium macrosclerotiorum TaxID=303699 RepID=UPI002548333E|nr:uncharacterized protein N7462_005674 [Penicillium macrosclerotiorum]KAJ5682509.1 hypothetical protein N7462_005674 [Penicillium macrosclerotiorum]
MAEPRDETTSFTQGLAIGRMVRATLVLSGANPAQSTKDSSDGNMSALIEPSQVPRKHLAALLMSRFVDVVAVQFMHLSPLELWGDFDLFFRAPENPSQHLSECQPAKAFNVYIAMAIGSLLLPEQRSFQGLASNLHDAAMKLFPRMMSSGTKLDMLHCMILLTLYSLYSARGGSAWHHIGLAMKKAIAFRFHKDPDATIQISPEILRKRRNVFWSLYVLDRNISYWKDSVAGSDPSAQFPGTCFMQLSCRAFVEIFRSKGSATTEYNLVHSSGAIKNEILKNSTEYIQEEYNRSDRGEFVGGFVDAYDIFAAGVVVICLSGEVSPPSRDNSIINKCTALLTLLGEKFSGLRVFRRVLWALSDYALGNPVTDTIIQEIPSIIPNGIKMVILRFIATGPVIST